MQLAPYRPVLWMVTLRSLVPGSRSCLSLIRISTDRQLLSSVMTWPPLPMMAPTCRQREVRSFLSCSQAVPAGCLWKQAPLDLYDDWASEMQG